LQVSDEYDFMGNDNDNDDDDDDLHDGNDEEDLYDVMIM
jgi:hypothetical protein